MLETILNKAFEEAYQQLYLLQPESKYIVFQKTRPEFEGDMTIVVFPFTKAIGKSPDVIANDLGSKMLELQPILNKYNVVKGFLNLVVSDDYWFQFYEMQRANERFGDGITGKGKKIVIEYSSPNTNKPLHLGHIRNNLIGWSVAEILKSNGFEVIKVNLVNDRGIHICKSMLAWQKWGKQTPEERQMKGDKLVGEMYVLFDKALKTQIALMVETGILPDDAARKAPLMLEAQEMLRKWEAGDQEIKSLWKTMNNWVYAGFDVTYKQLGIDFDHIYYESETYLLGKDLVLEGLGNSLLQQKEDQSIWCDLTSEGLDEKLLLRADGTSVYMTQDLGTAQLRAHEYFPYKMIYVVGNEQNYHFDVLKLVLKKLGFEWADSIEHLSYGMVELPEGKMKSREGTVVDADDLMDEMIATASKTTTELGKSADLPPDEAQLLFYQIGLGALKYFMLKVDPKKTMLFNPEESIDFNGNTGPFIQYTHARIRSILRKATKAGIIHFDVSEPHTELHPKEKDLLKLIYKFPSVVLQAGDNRSPALIANYMYDLAKEFNQFYQAEPIFKEQNEDLRNFRLGLSAFTGKILRKAGGLLGMQMPEKM
ncbi:MAG: arginine--tRNA ligase [Bacteroidetes bacterium HGW-Bacteroidetes-1]|jgi:arginyl-tRNA synthetase|nr:MAG: arginine--tRNA ligase [Bacteroidetes bacterium HGW-Bacteroidetes-1]